MAFATKEQQAAYYAAWKIRNLEHWKEYQRQYYLRNRAKRIAYATARNRADQPAANARSAAWKKRHPEKVVDYEHQRRARLRGGEFESVNRNLVYERDGGRCHICGKHVPKNQVSLDHLIPVADGGPHTYRNVGLAHTRCNVRRNRGGPAQLRLVG